MNICVVGDSITWGAFLPFRAAWANLLRNYLESKNDKVALYDLGIDADTTNNLLKRLKNELDARMPDIIIFAIGINDSAYRKTDKQLLITTPEDFKINLNKLIQQGKRFTNKIIFVGLVKGSDNNTCPLPRSTTGKCYKKERVRTYDKMIKDACRKHKLIFVNVINLLKNEDFDDGLHPNIGGHQKIFEAVRRELHNNRLI